MALSSWKCKGCTNICFRNVDGETFKYCRPVIEKGGIQTEWQGDKFVCLDYTTDPSATDHIVQLHECMMRTNNGK